MSSPVSGLPSSVTNTGTAAYREAVESQNIRDEERSYTGRESEVTELEVLPLEHVNLLHVAGQAELLRHLLTILLSPPGVRTKDVVAPQQPLSTERRTKSEIFSCLEIFSAGGGWRYLKMVRSPTWSSSTSWEVKLDWRAGKAPAGSWY